MERVCEWALLVKSVSKLYLQVDLICQLDICSVIDRSRVRFPVAAALAATFVQLLHQIHEVLVLSIVLHELHGVLVLSLVLHHLHEVLL